MESGVHVPTYVPLIFVRYLENLSVWEKITTVANEGRIATKLKILDYKVKDTRLVPCANL